MTRVKEMQDIPLSFAAELTGSLTRTHWVRWLVKHGHHNRGVWRRESGSFNKVPFGELPPFDGSIWESIGITAPPSRKRKMSTRVRHWGEYYKARGFPSDCEAALVLSFVLTLFHGISTVCGMEDRDVIKIHYLGPEKELDGLELFEELAWLLPNSQIEITFVGPKVPQHLHDTTVTWDADSQVQAHFHRGLYHELPQSVRSQCDVITGLNAGLAAYDSFSETVRVIAAAANQGVPAVFSDVNEESATMAAEALHKAGVELSLPIAVNPFRSPRTEQGDKRSFAIPSQSNGFMFAVGTPRS